MMSLPPYLLALLAALAFAVCGHVQGLGLIHLGPRHGVAVMLCAATLAFSLIAPFAMTGLPPASPALLYFAAVGLFLPSVSMSLAVLGVRYLGATLLNTLASTQPIFGALVGLLIFGETMGWALAFGTVGIVMGGLLVLLRTGNSAARVWPLWALLLPVGMALIRTAGQAFTKIGLSEVPDPLLSSLISTAVSTAIIVMSLHIAPQRVRLNSQGLGIAAFASAGGLFALGAFLLNSALARGDLVEVAPMLALVPIFSVALSVLVFKTERLSAGFILAVGLITGSVLVVALFR